MYRIKSTQILNNLLHKPKLAEDEEAQLTNAINSYFSYNPMNPKDKKTLIPPGPVLVRIHLKTQGALRSFLVKLKRFYQMSNGDLRMLKNHLRSDPHPQTLAMFQTLAGTQINQRIVTFDHFDAMASHMIIVWFTLHKVPAIKLQMILDLIDSL